ncbi:protein containing DUF1703 [Candidatus Omnitrophus magneticus]|uniref:Protein containing DUF1703 n=1 Tax=Candidatus Omnitrophus magneticus TaxID=1609969 RepID=A0A0F0CSN3_9BACT|nr:protein containing DUF1703 [Candidatus Omnitrophus magneticus]
MRIQKLPVGESDFKTIIDNKFYYIDKTLFIKEIIDESCNVILLPRPRRFGKTLNLSMLRYFFEKTEKSNGYLFKDLAICRLGEEYMNQQGAYPVIFLTLKDVKEKTWDTTYRGIKDLIQNEFLRHKYLKNWTGLEKEEKEYFNKITSLEGSEKDYENSLKTLSLFLERYHNKKVIILLDEYDTPIQSGYLENFYEHVISFMRNFLSGGFKDNTSLEKGVLTGILRVSKESIFSGMNNLGVFTLLSHKFADKFGFTEKEVLELLKAFNLEHLLEDVRRWYNGYNFRGVTIYNPWSIVSYASTPEDGLQPYWGNTANSAIIHELMTRGGVELREELEKLIKGEVLAGKEIEENTIFSDIKDNDDLVWSFLLLSGYLTCEKTVYSEDTANFLCDLKVPNKEICSIYKGIIKKWFGARIETKKREIMLNALLKGDIKLFDRLLKELVASVFSYHDFTKEPEKVYQAFIIGLFVWLENEYEIKSDREAGYGKADVILIPRDKKNIGFVIEFKAMYEDDDETPESAVKSALTQIEERKYDLELISRGIKKIKKLAIVFQGKKVWVKENNKKL